MNLRGCFYGLGQEHSARRFAQGLARKSDAHFRSRKLGDHCGFQQALKIYCNIEFMLPKALDLPSKLRQKLIDPCSADRSCVDLDQVVDQGILAKDLGCAGFNHPGDIYRRQCGPSMRERWQRVYHITYRTELYKQNPHPRLW